MVSLDRNPVKNRGRVLFANASLGRGNEDREAIAEAQRKLIALRAVGMGQRAISKALLIDPESPAVRRWTVGKRPVPIEIAREINRIFVSV